MDQTTNTRRMVYNLISSNSEMLQTEMAWFSLFLETRIATYLGLPCDYESPHNIPVPDLEEEVSVYAEVIHFYGMTHSERLLLMLALIPHIAPEHLDPFFVKNQNTNRYFTEFGGLINPNHNGFLPTVETALFLLAGDNLKEKLSLKHLFRSEHYFSEANIIKLNNNPGSESFLNQRLTLSEEYLSILIEGTAHKPEFSLNFPAKLITTGLEWSELVLRPETHEQVDELLGWIQHGEELMEEWGLSRKFSKGYRCLFYGPPGTGKTLTACLLGKVTNRDVYRIDLSMVVSKYIGETEKNLAGIFDQAENKNWVLFFDEADSLFGKRTKTQSSNDRHANQEVSYLLQRIEDFDGLVVLATNLKSNLDKAFHRRFQAMIEFPMPGSKARQKLWETGFPEACRLDPTLDLAKIAQEFQLAGGAIMNVIRFACLKSKMRGSKLILADDVLLGIRREVRKDGKTI